MVLQQFQELGTDSILKYEILTGTPLTTHMVTLTTFVNNCNFTGLVVSDLLDHKVRADLFQLCDSPAKRDSHYIKLLFGAQASRSISTNYFLQVGH